MQTLNLKFTIEQIMDLVKQLPNSIKLELAQSWTTELQQPSSILPDFDLEGWEDDIDLNSYAIEEKAIEPIKALWTEEPPAEELCKMLNA